MKRYERWHAGGRLWPLVAAAVLLAGCSGGSSALLSYVGGSVEGAYEVFQVRGDGSEPTPLFVGLPGLGQTVIWSPDGETAIVYNRSEGQYYLAQAVGGTYGQCLTCGLEPYGPPVFSPDGSRIAVPARDGLYLSSSGAAAPAPVSTIPRPGYLAWAPDGQSLLFVAVEGRFGIYRFDLSTGLVRRLTEGLAGDATAPSWSPSGDRIAFHALDGGGLHLMTMNADGTGVTLVADWDYDVEILDPGLLLPPQWSPGGDRLAFPASSALGDLDLFTVRPDGRDLTNITNYPGADDNPAWSPDGSLLAFRSDRDGNWDIFVMAADGSNVINVTRTSGTDECCPAWRP